MQPVVMRAGATVSVPHRLALQRIRDTILQRRQVMRPEVERGLRERAQTQSNFNAFR